MNSTYATRLLRLRYFQFKFLLLIFLLGFICFLFLKQIQLEKDIEDLIEINFKMVELQETFSHKIRKLNKIVSIEDVEMLTITAYSATKSQCDDDPNVAASMRPPKPGTVAVSRDLFKNGWVFGKKIYIEGKGIFEVNDLMNSRLKKQIDIFMPTTQMALNFGKKELHAMLLRI